MSRQHLSFEVSGVSCAATLDMAAGTTGLLIVSGGNEIRSGAHGGQAQMASYFAAKGYPVFRYDRRGAGDSEGDNNGFDTSADDIAAAINAFREYSPALTKIVAFGNCDAASALALFHGKTRVDSLVLANPWVIETAETSAEKGASQDTPTPPSAAAIRSRYWARIKNPRSLIDLFTGKIDLRKLLGGLLRAAKKEDASDLSIRIAAALAASNVPAQILIAKGDTTALAFMGAWHSKHFNDVRAKSGIAISSFDTPSHSFAGIAAKSWLIGKIEAALEN